MSKIIIIPEPHISYKNIEGRIDYVKEIKGYMNIILQHIYNDEGISNVVFVGDIFNRGFKDVEEYFYWIDWFGVLNDMLKFRGGKIYSAVGNHEISYQKLNPFWRLTSSKDSGYNTKMRWSNKSVFPMGFNSTIHIEDIVDIDSCTLFFCHYGKMNELQEIVDKHIKEYGDSKIRICVSHNSIISDEIVRVLRVNHHRDPLSNYIQYEQIKSLNLFHKFDYVFNGHMHRAYSRFTLSTSSHNTCLLYLGSLGRTNSGEIDDSDLERVCPIYDIDNNELSNLYIELTDRKSTLSEGYSVGHEDKILDNKTYTDVCRKIIDVEDPILELMNAIEDREILVALECAISSNIPHKFDELRHRMEEI